MIKFSMWLGGWKPRLSGLISVGFRKVKIVTQLRVFLGPSVGCDCPRKMTQL